MKNEIRANYIKEYPQSKRLLEKINSKEKTDKGQACALIRAVEELGVECLGMLEKALSNEKDENTKVCIQFVLDTFSDKLKNYRVSVQEYLRCSDMANQDTACKKYEQRSRAEHEDIAVKFYICVLGYKDIIKNKSYIRSYNRRDGRMSVLSSYTDEKKKNACNADEFKYWCKPHYMDLSKTQFTSKGFKRYVTQQKGKRLSYEDRKWLDDNFYIPFVDLSLAPIRTIYLAMLKAQKFRERWGFEEADMYEYQLNIPQESKYHWVCKDEITDNIYFRVYNGVKGDFVVYSYKNEISRYSFICPENLGRIYSNFDDIEETILSTYAFGYIDKDGYIEELELIFEEKVYGSCDRYNSDFYFDVLPTDEKFNETVTYKDEDYVCTEPYEFTLAEVKENYKEEQAQKREREKARKKMRREIREIHEKFWVPIRELKPLYRQYVKYLQAQSEGKMLSAPLHMTFRRYFLWAERGYPMDERSHQSTVVNVVLPPVEEPSEEVREALRAKYNFQS